MGLFSLVLLYFLRLWIKIKIKRKEQNTLFCSLFHIQVIQVWKQMMESKLQFWAKNYTFKVIKSYVGCRCVIAYSLVWQTVHLLKCCKLHIQFIILTLGRRFQPLGENPPEDSVLVYTIILTSIPVSIQTVRTYWTSLIVQGKNWRNKNITYLPKTTEKHREMHETSYSLKAKTIWNHKPRHF